MTNRVIALFVEGPTEVEFYKTVIVDARNLMGIPYSCEIEYVDMKGIGNYKKDALRRFKTLKSKHPDKDIIVFLCIDNDVFEFSRKPPFDRTVLKESLKEAGAQKVAYIVAKESIEEWFLCDFEGVIKYLRLPQNTKRPKKNGQEAIKDLFKKANKIYVKGSKIEGFIEKLNVRKIVKTYCNSLSPLCKSLGLNCQLICGKQIIKTKGKTRF